MLTTVNRLRPSARPLVRTTLAVNPRLALVAIAPGAAIETPHPRERGAHIDAIA